MASVRQQTRVAGARERRTALLYAMSRELAATRGSREHGAGRGAARRRSISVPGRGAAAGRGRQAALSASRLPLESSLRGADLAVAQWVIDHGRRAGLGTDTLPAAPALYVPLGDRGAHLGVLAVLPSNARRVLLPEQRHLLGDVCRPDRARAGARAAGRTGRKPRASPPKRERLRNTLLASISHDLRTPLAVMAGAGSTLAEHGAALDEATRAHAGALDRDQGARDVGAGLERARPDAVRIGPGRRCGATGRRSMISSAARCAAL